MNTSPSTERSKAETPIVLYYDTDDQLAKAAIIEKYPGEGPHYLPALMTAGRIFSRIEEDMIFWDYLRVEGSTDRVGILLNDFDLNSALVKSSLLRQSRNVQHEPGFGYDILLEPAVMDFSYDTQQAFGHAIYTNGADCLLRLSNWDEQEYCFPLQRDVVFAVT